MTTPPPAIAESRKRLRSPSSSSVCSSPKRPASEDPPEWQDPNSPASQLQLPVQSQLSHLAVHSVSPQPEPTEPDDTVMADAPDLAASSPPTQPDVDVTPADRFTHIRGLQSQTIAIGSTWYLISRSWWRRFEIACSGEVGKGEHAVTQEELGPVDNGDLFESDELKQGLVDGDDLVMVPEEAWEALVRWYGAPSHPLPRPVVPAGASGQGRIDFYPFRLHVVLLTNGPPRAPVTTSSANVNGDDTSPAAAPFTPAQILDIYPSQPLSTLYGAAIQLIPSLAPPSPLPTPQPPVRLWKLDERPTPDLLKSSHYPYRRLLAHGGKLLPSPPPPSRSDAETSPPLSDPPVDDLLVSGDFLLLEVANPAGKFPVLDPENVAGNRSSSPQPVATSPRAAAAPLPLFGSGASPPGQQSKDFFSRLQPDTSRGPLTVKLRAPAALPSPPESSTSDGGGKGKEREKKERERRGTVGLGNLGNTCFMNSALQCLAHTEELTEYFLTEVFRTELNPDNPLGMGGQIAESFSFLLQKLWAPTTSSFSSFSPREFKATLARFAPSFSGYQQHDSQELLAFLLDGLHEDLNRVLKKPYVEKPDWPGEGGARELVKFAKECWEGYERRNDSVIVDLFQGQYKSTLVCPECEKVSITFDPYMYLTLPLPVTKKWRGVVFFIPWLLETKQKKIMIELPKEANFRMLKQRVGELTGTDHNNLFASEPYEHRFWKYFDDTHPVSDVQEKDIVAVFELPCAISQPRAADHSKSAVVFEDPDWILVPIFMAHSTSRRRMHDWGLFAYPFVLPLTKQQASDEDCVYEQLAHRVSRVTDRRAAMFLDGSQKVVEQPEKGPATEGEQDSEETDMKEDGEVVEKAEAESEAEPKDVQMTNGEPPEHGRGWTAKNGMFKMHLVEPSRYPGEGVLITGWSMESQTRQVSWEDRRDEARGVRVLPGGFKEEDDEEDILDGEVREPHKPLIHLGEAIVCEWSGDAYDYLFTGGAAVWDSWDEIMDPARAASDEAAREAGSRGITLADCLSEFTREEQLGADDLWYCPRCKKHQQATKRFELWSVPDILVVHLKRFSSSRLMRDKIDAFVEFPVEGLNLNGRVEETRMLQEIAREDGKHGEEDEPLLYDLFAVDEHMGGLGGGHYRAYAKNHVDGEWYHFDDSHVTRIADPQQAVNSNAYLLFYRRRTSRPIGGKTHEKIEEARKAREASKPAAQITTPDNPFVDPPASSQRALALPLPGFGGVSMISPASTNSSGSASGPSYSPPSPPSFDLSGGDSLLLSGGPVGFDDRELDDIDDMPRQLVVRGSAPSPYGGSTSAEMGNSGVATPSDVGIDMERVTAAALWSRDRSVEWADDDGGAGGEATQLVADGWGGFAPPWANADGPTYQPSPPPFLPTPPEPDSQPLAPVQPPAPVDLPAAPVVESVEKAEPVQAPAGPSESAQEEKPSEEVRSGVEEKKTAEKEQEEGGS